MARRLSMAPARLNGPDTSCSGRHHRRPQLQFPSRATLTATRLPADEVEPAMACGNQLLKVERGPAAAGRAVGGKRVVVLVQGLDCVKANHTAVYA